MILTIVNLFSFIALVLAYAYLSFTFNCTLTEQAAFGLKKTTYKCFFNNYVMSQIILLLGSLQ